MELPILLPLPLGHILCELEINPWVCVCHISTPTAPSLKVAKYVRPVYRSDQCDCLRNRLLPSPSLLTGFQFLETNYSSDLNNNLILSVFLFNVCGCFTCICVCAPVRAMSLEPEEIKVLDAFGTGVRAGCELLFGCRSQTQGLWKSSRVLNRLLSLISLFLATFVSLSIAFVLNSMAIHIMIIVVFQDRILLHISGSSRTHLVGQAGLERIKIHLSLPVELSLLLSFAFVIAYYVCSCGS